MTTESDALKLVTASKFEQHADLDAPDLQNVDGYVEFLGYRSDMPALFIGGWSDRVWPDKAQVKVSAEFEQVILFEHLNIFFYERQDVSDRGVGFIIFFQWESELPRLFRAIEIVNAGIRYRIRPTSDIFNLPDTKLISHLYHILPNVKDEGQRNDLTTVLAGKGYVDYAFRYDGIVVVEGWIFGFSRTISIRTGSRAISEENVCVFDRPDVSEIYNSRGAKAYGFVLVLREDFLEGPITCDLGMSESIINVQIPDQAAGIQEIEGFILRHTKRTGFLVGRTIASSKWLKAMVPQLATAPEESKETRGHIEQSRGIDNLGGLVIGWSIAVLPWRIYLVSAEGSARQLADASRWNRPDVVDLFGREYGPFCQNAGFLCAIHGPIITGTAIYLIAVNADSAYKIGESQWSRAPVEPVSFARWAFDFPVPNGDLSRRFEMHDRPILSTLIEKRNRSLRDSPAAAISFGTQNEDPVCSLIIPLYGRYDFMRHQMLEFTEDSTIARRTEIIYVVDDPTIANDVREFSSVLFRSMEIPFRIIVGNVNRGFAGATNLGAHHAKSNTLLLLNSDVIPQRPGWLDQMLLALEGDRNIGAVGARLLYGNSCLQHDGMTFHWEPSWNAYLNKHPGAGMRPSRPQSAPVPCLAVTAACCLVPTKTYNQVFGLDEGFLIGDFEDSDLCLKIQQLGMSVVCVQDVNLVHLERQSFSGIGTGNFRERLARYNALTHQKRWGNTIRKLMHADSGTPR